MAKALDCLALVKNIAKEKFYIIHNQHLDFVHHLDLYNTMYCISFTMCF